MSYAETYKPQNASSSVIKPDLSGLIPEGLSVYPAELYFGALVIGEDQLIRSFKVKNIGRRTLKILDLEIQQEQDQFEIQGGWPDLVRPGDEFDVNVRYFSDFVGLNTAVVVITTTDPRSPYTVKLSGRVVGSTYIEAAFEGFKAIVEEEATARADADGAEALHRLTLQASLEAEDLLIKASVVAEQVARVNAVSAEAANRVAAVATLNSSISNVSASVTAEQVARVNAVNALAADITALAATVATGQSTTNAAILDEATARADADEAMASRITTIEADYTTAGQASSIASALVAIEATARANADTAIATNVTTLTSTVGGHTSTLTTHSAAISSLNGKNQAYWYVMADAGNGRAQLRVYADAYGSAGVDITGDVRIFGSVQIYGNVVVNGTIDGALKIIPYTITTTLIQTEAISKRYYTSTSADVIANAGNPNVNFAPTGMVKDDAGSSVDATACIIFQVNGGSGDLSGNILIYRDGSVIWGIPIILNGAGDGLLLPVSFSFTDTGADAGSHTYLLRYERSAFAGTNVYVKAGTYFRVEEKKR